MNTVIADKVRRPHVTVIEVIVVLLITYLVAIRLTVLVSLLVLAILYILFPLHRSRRALTFVFILFLFAVLVPVDVYVRDFHGPLMDGKHSGLRFVRVLYGLGAHPEPGAEAVSGGCVVRPHDTRWVLVWD